MARSTATVTGADSTATTTINALVPRYIGANASRVSIPQIAGNPHIPAANNPRVSLPSSMPNSLNFCGSMALA